MEHIPDKAFDQLIKDHFEDAQMQPSAAVWENIGRELKSEPRKKVAGYWVAAATVVIALSVSLLLTRTDQVTTQDKAGLVRVGKPAVDTGSLPTGEENTSKSSAGPLKSKLVLELPVESPELHSNSGKEVEGISTRLRNKQNAHPMVPEPQLANLNVPVNGVEAKMLQENERPAVASSLIASRSEVLARVDITPSAPAFGGDVDLSSRDEGDTRTRIRNAGDLVNFVVDKIDKREQKLVEFNTDDDENSSLVAINIGPFRFNSKKHK